jgi:hypothetical protein
MDLIQSKRKSFHPENCAMTRNTHRQQSLKGPSGALWRSKETRTMTRKVPKSAKPTPPTKPAAKTYILFGADEYAKPRAARFATSDPEPLAKAAESLHLRLVEVTGEDLAEIATRLPAGRLHASGKGLVPYVKGAIYAELVAITSGELELPANADAVPQDGPRTWDEIAPGHLVVVKEAPECGWWEAIVLERIGDMVTVRYRDVPRYPALVRHRSAVALINLPTS